MKKLIAVIALIVCTSVQAEDHRRGDGRNERHHDGAGIAAPLIIGGLIGYALSQSTREQPIYIDPAMTTPPPIVYAVPPGMRPVYRQEWDYDRRCNCYVSIMRQVGWR